MHWSKSFRKATQNFTGRCKRKGSFTEESPICSVCRYSFCVSVEGNVFPCAGWQTNIVGDLKRQTVEEIWINSKKLKNYEK